MVSFFVIQVLLVIPNWCDNKPAVCFLPASCELHMGSNKHSDVLRLSLLEKRNVLLRIFLPSLAQSGLTASCLVLYLLHVLDPGAQCEEWLWTMCGVRVLLL